jgi:O-antigen/teichoic acid export membrane protein
VNRTHKAAVSAAFSYAQFGLAIVTGIVLVPLVLHFVGARPYGLWLASGELLGYAGMIDLGVLGVLPWLVAEADGRQDRDLMRRLVASGLTVGLVVAAGFLVVAAVLWRTLPSMLWLTADDRSLIVAPLVLVVFLTAVGYPLRVFRAVLGGLQDVVFNGALSLAQSILTVTITIVLLVRGHGLWALAWAPGGAALVIMLVAVGRVAAIAPDLLVSWHRPLKEDIQRLLSNGAGVWLGNLGWQLLAASNSIVITYLGHPEWVPIYACTAKVAVLSTQLSWVLPDSALVGLAQLHGERQARRRVTNVVAALLSLHLILAGVAACGLLAFNGSFVTAWVGAEFFGGTTLNALLAASIVSSSLVHGLVTTTSLLGNRLQVGVITMANGLAQLACAVYLGHRFGLPGVAAAMVVTDVVTALPACLYLLRQSTDLTARRFAAEVAAPWATRMGVPLVAAVATGLWYTRLGLWPNAALAAALCLVSVWTMRDLYARLPLGDRFNRWLVTLGLLPAVTTPAAGQS